MRYRHVIAASLVFAAHGVVAAVRAEAPDTGDGEAAVDEGGTSPEVETTTRARADARRELRESPSAHHIIVSGRLAGAAGEGQIVGAGARYGLRVAPTVDVEFGAGLGGLSGFGQGDADVTLLLDARAVFAQPRGNRAGVFFGTTFAARRFEEWFIAPQVGITTRFGLGDGTVRPHVGVAVFLQPWIPFDGQPVEVMYGFDLEFTLGLGRYRLPPPDDLDASPFERLEGLLASEVSDVAWGDPSASACRLRVGADGSVTVASPDESACLSDLTQSIPGRTCAFLIFVGEDNERLDMTLRASGQVVRDTSGSSWPTLMACNGDAQATDDVSLEVELADGGDGFGTNLLGTRFDIPLPGAGGAPYAECGQERDGRASGELAAGRCCVRTLRRVERGDAAGPTSLSLTFPEAVDYVRLWAPWYAEMQAASADDGVTLDGTEGGIYRRLWWSRRQAMRWEGGTQRGVTVSAPTVDAPVVVCASDTPDAEDEDDEDEDGEGGEAGASSTENPPQTDAPSVGERPAGGTETSGEAASPPPP